MRIDPAILRGRGVASLSEGPKAVLPMQQIAPPRADCSEAEFQAAVAAAAKMHDWLHYHTHDSRRSGKGFLDSVLTRGGRLLILELKVPPNKPTAEQKMWLAALALVPGIYSGVMYPSDWPTILELLA